jgi:phosphoglycolate phosphatase-like HAD superfamily hydrolase
MHSVTHVCFDKDGTLTDVHSYWHHTCALRASYLRHRLALTSTAEEALMTAMGIDRCSGRIREGGPIGYYPRETVIQSAVQCLEQHGILVTSEVVSGLFRDVDEHQQATGDFAVMMLPGVREYLDYLHGIRIQVSVFTSDRKASALGIFDRLGISERIAVVIGGGCVQKPKPHPEGFLIACNTLGTSPSRSAYVSDTLLDLEMAQAGGASAAIGVTTGLDSRETLTRRANRVCDRLDELISAAV